MKKIINRAIAIIRKINIVFNNNRAEVIISKEIVQKIGNTVYTVQGFFKKKGTVTADEKLFRLMQKELDAPDISCYTDVKESLDCKPILEGRAV